MADKHSTWWTDGCSQEDEVIMRFVGMAKKLLRLPGPDDMVSFWDKETMKMSLTYFGSFEAALRKVAKLLYGNEALTSPIDLLPSEKELDQAE